MDAMVEPILFFEERSGVRIALRLRDALLRVRHRIAMRTHALVQTMQIAARAERFLA